MLVIKTQGNDSRDIISLINRLDKENISFTAITETIDVRPDGGVGDTFVGTIITGIAVVATKELVKLLIKWLKERKRFGQPTLKIRVEGNILNLNLEDMKTLTNILKEATKHKEKRREKTRL
jgi:hypothetical protein